MFFAFVPVTLVAEKTAGISPAFVIVHVFKRNITADLWTIAFRQIFKLVHKKPSFR